MLYRLWWIEQQLTCTHAHTQSSSSVKLTFWYLHFCDTSLTSNTLFCALPLALARLCMSQLPELNNDRQKEWKPVKLLSCISFSLHNFYFPMKLYKLFLFTLLLQKCCLPASVRCHNYVLKQQTYTDTQTTNISGGCKLFISLRLKRADLWSNFSCLRKVIQQRHN